MEERGQYITLLCLQHQQGHLSKKTMLLAVGEVSDDVLAKFEQDEHGLFYQHRMEEETEKRENYVDSKRKNGAKGGRPKTDRLTDRFSLGLAKANLVENENENINRDINIPSIDNSDSNSSNKYLDRFTEFWQIYPKKTGKEAAKREFLRIKPSQELTDRMIEKIKELCQSDQWRREGGKFIPNPSTWLHQGRWDDETSISLYREAKKTADEPLPF